MSWGYSSIGILMKQWQEKIQMRHIEFEEQVKIFHWASLQKRKYPMLEFIYSSQAGEKLKNAIVASRAKRAGMRSGVPDIFLPFPKGGYHGLFIELKRPVRKGYAKPVVSEEQKRFLTYLNEVGYCAKVCYGAEQAIQLIQLYAKGELNG